MKLEDFVLSIGSHLHVHSFVVDLFAPYIVHEEDMNKIVDKICKSQFRIPTPAHSSMCMWDIAWPDRAWRFCRNFRLYNKPSNDPACIKYIDPVIQFSISKNKFDNMSVFIYHRLVHPLSK